EEAKRSITDRALPVGEPASQAAAVSVAANRTYSFHWSCWTRWSRHSHLHGKCAYWQRTAFRATLLIYRSSISAEKQHRDYRPVTLASSSITVPAFPGNRRFALCTHQC